MVDRALRPQIFEIETSHPNAEKKYRHWKTTLENYLSTILTEPAETDNEDANTRASLTHDRKKFFSLVNNISSEVYELVSECTSFDAAITALDAAYIRPHSIIYNRHKLITLKQDPGKSIDEYKLDLERIAKTCNFQAVSAKENRDHYVRDAFISGISVPYIRQRLLEHVGDLSLDAALATARSLEQAQAQSSTYETQVAAAMPSPDSNESLAAMRGNNKNNNSSNKNTFKNNTNNGSDGYKNRNDREVSNNEKCYFCGDARHPRSDCKARNAVCNNCGKTGHWKKVCKSGPSLPLGAIGQTPSTQSQSPLPSLA